MKQKIIQIINKKHKISNGSCGTYLTKFVKTLEIPYSEFEAIITEMYNNEEIEIRE